MSEDVRRTPPWEKTKEPTAATPEALGEQADAAKPAGPTAADDATVGTGSVIALGCIAGTLLLIVIGLIYLAIAVIF